MLTLFSEKRREDIVTIAELDQSKNRVVNISNHIWRLSPEFALPAETMRLLLSVFNLAYDQYTMTLARFVAEVKADGEHLHYEHVLFFSCASRRYRGIEGLF